MNTTPSPSSAPKLPTEDQVRAFLYAKASEIQRSRGIDRLQLAYHAHSHADGFTAISASLSVNLESGIHGENIDTVLRQYDEQYSPAALLTRAKNLRAEADAIVAKLALAAPVKIEEATRILMVEENVVTTRGEIVARNLDGTEASEIARWRAELSASGEVKVGGGAAAAFTLRIAA